MTIYVDGACSGNTSTGGFGVVVLDETGSLIRTYKEKIEDTTNNRMELSAILWVMMKYGKETIPIVYSDSAYAVKTLSEWSWGWKQKGWVKSDNKIPENLDLVMLFHNLWDRGYRVELHQCKGHSGNKWNDLADKLAVAARGG